MNIIPIKEYYIRSEVEKDVDFMYLFTDNLSRTSGNIQIINKSLYYDMYCRNGVKHYPTKTQACIRGLVNVFPISTMKSYGGEQFTDEDFNLFKSNLDSEIHVIKCYSHLFKGIKYNNEMPFGNANISTMNISAPKCWEYLNKKLLEINIDNENI